MPAIEEQLNQISDTDGNTIVAWAKAAKIILYADSAIKLYDFCQRHGFPVAFDALSAGLKSSELHGQLEYDTWDSNYDSLQALVRDFTNYCPKGLLNASGTGVTPEVAGRLTHIIRAQYGRHFSIPNLLGAANVLQEEMFGPAAAPPKSPEQLRGEAVSRREQREADERFKQLQMNRRGLHTSDLESELRVAKTNHSAEQHGEDVKEFQRQSASKTERPFRRLPENPTKEQLKAASPQELREFLSRARKPTRTL